MKISVGISNRHVHLSFDDYKALFNNTNFTKRNDLTQGMEFASTLTVTIKGPKGEISNVRVLGPLRSYTQVEVSQTDAYKLGITPPVASSGNLEDASNITIINGPNMIERKCCIIQNRHIHLNKDEQLKYKLFKDVYEIRVGGVKGVILENVHLKVNDNFNFELHLDTDDANCCLLKNGDMVDIINTDIYKYNNQEVYVYNISQEKIENEEFYE